MSEPARCAPGLSRARRWWVCAVLSASLLVITMDMTILNIAIPDLSTDLAPSANQLLWIVDSYALVLAGMLVPVSAVGDRWGRKRMLLSGYLMFGAASALVLAVHSAGQVIALRSLLGLGGAMIMPTTLALLRVVFTDAAERAVALAVWAAMAGVGSAVGPLVGGLLLEQSSWRSAFLVNVPLMAVAVVAGLVLLPESRSTVPGRWDGVAAAESLFGMVAVVWAVKEFAKQQSLAVPVGWLVLVAGVGLLVDFVRRCLTADEPFLDLRLFVHRRFTAGVVAALGSMLALAAALLLVAQWMELVVGLSPVRTGLEMAPSAIAGVVTSLISPWLAGRFGARPVLGGSVGLTGAGMVAFGCWPGGIDEVGAVLALTLIGAGFGALTIGSVLIMSVTSEDQAGSAAAIEEVAYDVGNVLGVALLGSLAAIVYRAGLDARQVLDALPPESADAARGSIGNAIAEAERHDVPAVAQAAAAEFARSLEITGLVGGVLLVGVAAVVCWLIPRGTDLTDVPAH